MDYYIDVYIKRPKYWMKKYGFKEVNGKYGTHLSIKVDEKKKKRLYDDLIGVIQNIVVQKPVGIEARITERIFSS